MAKHREEQKLALQGGMKAVATIEGKGRPKIDMDEFMAVARRFGFSAKTLKKIRAAQKADGNAGVVEWKGTSCRQFS